MVTDCFGCEGLSSGIPKGCTNNIGGIKKLWITELCNILSLTKGSPTTEISAINMSPGKKFYEFVFNKNTSTWTEVTESDPVNGTELFIQTVLLKLGRREKSKRDKIALIGMFKDLAIIIQDNNDVYWLIGEEGGANLQNNNSPTGTTKKDFNGYEITFVAEEPAQAETIAAAAVTAVVSA